jgi:pyruvate dehydrogenase E2 component (dihydrolipoamide acetyltransferase)
MELGEIKEKTEGIEAPSEPEGKIVEFIRSPQPVSEIDTSRKIVPASPSVRRLAREIGVDITQITGSGPGGRITEEDVKNFAKKLADVRVKSAEAKEEAMTTRLRKGGEVERVSMNIVRRLTAERMSSAWRVPRNTAR